MADSRSPPQAGGPVPAALTRREVQALPWLWLLGARPGHRHPWYLSLALSELYHRGERGITPAMIAARAREMAAAMGAGAEVVGSLTAERAWRHCLIWSQEGHGG